MPWKDPGNWISAELMAPILSFVLALFRAMYQDNEPSWLKRITEAAMCGMITLSVGYGIDAMGLDGDWEFAAAGTIGFLGVDYIKTLIKKFLIKKVDGGEK